jgi:hypothetical protein
MVSPITDNPETRTTLGRKHRTKTNNVIQPTTEKAKKMSKTDPNTNKLGVIHI